MVLNTLVALALALALVAETVGAGAGGAAFEVGELSVLTSVECSTATGDVALVDAWSTELTRVGSIGIETTVDADACDEERSAAASFSWRNTCSCSILHGTVGSSCRGCSESPGLGPLEPPISVLVLLANARHCATCSSDVASITCLLHIGHWTKLDPPPPTVRGPVDVAAGPARRRAPPRLVRFCFLVGGAPLPRPHNVVCCMGGCNLAQASALYVAPLLQRLVRVARERTRARTSLLKHR